LDVVMERVEDVLDVRGLASSHPNSIEYSSRIVQIPSVISKLSKELFERVLKLSSVATVRKVYCLIQKVPQYAVMVSRSSGRVRQSDHCLKAAQGEMASCTHMSDGFEVHYVGR
jgi:hypothetical protein